MLVNLYVIGLKEFEINCTKWNYRLLSKTWIAEILKQAICKHNTIDEGTVIKIKNSFPDFNEDIHEKLLKDGWRELREPKSLIGQVVLSIPFMIITLLMSQLIMGILIPTSRINDYQISGSAQNAEEFLEYILVPLLIALVIAVLMEVIHGLIHLLLIPNFNKSDNTYLGFTYFGGYVYTTDVLLKSRACLIYIAPFIVLSIILNVVSGLLGLYNIPLMLFILFNSIESGTDILPLILILLQVPKSAKIVNNGTHTYFRADPKNQFLKLV